MFLMVHWHYTVLIKTQVYTSSINFFSVDMGSQIIHASVLKNVQFRHKLLDQYYIIEVFR